ncbi:hypothetical protein I215_15591, partial [Galbibacter marinus]
MKIINLFLFCSFFIGFSNPVDNKITISNQATQCTVTVSVTHSSCTINGISSEDGTIKVEASATSGKTAIKWSSNTNSNLNQDKWEQTNLKPGEYDIEVFHNDKSVYHQKHIINAPDSFDISIEKTDNRCFGDKTGSISIDATGGTPPYQYSIDEGENFNNNPIFEKLPAGNYPVMVKDANNCIVSATIRIGQGRYFSISHPESIEIEACTSQKEINEAFTSWLAKFKHYGGTEPLNENLEHDPIPGPCGGSSKVTYTVVDDCGIEKTCEATFTVLEKDDLEIITEAQPLTVSCESDPQTAFQQWLTNNGNAKATSTCDIVWSNNYSEELWDNTCENSKNITVTFTAFNGCGELETTAMFSIEDTTAPVLSDTPEDIIVACDNIPEAVILTAIDNCDDTVSVEFEEKSTTDGCKSTLERIWT